MDTLSYWLARMEPLIRAETEGEIICVFANRTGNEDEATYAGTSAVLGIHGGEVKVYGILGRGEKELLVVDTNKRPQAKLVSEPNSTASEAKSASSKDASDSRTDSTVSDKSDLSLDTEAATVCTSPEPDDCPRCMEDIITPLSPVDPVSPNAYFAPKGRKPDGETLRDALKSSIGQPQFSTPEPNSPTFKRPASPKSRNASRTRQTEIQEPALISHDLAKEEQITQRATGVRSPPQPHSADFAQDQFQSFASSPFGPRSAHASPRPKSAIW